MAKSRDWAKAAKERKIRNQGSELELGIKKEFQKQREESKLDSAGFKRPPPQVKIPAASPNARTRLIKAEDYARTQAEENSKKRAAKLREEERSKSIRANRKAQRKRAKRKREGSNLAV